MTIEKDVAAADLLAGPPSSDRLPRPRAAADGGQPPEKRAQPPDKRRARWQDILLRRTLAADIVAVTIAVAAGYFVRFDTYTDVSLLEPRGGMYALISVVLVEAWVIALGVAGSRSPQVLGHGREEAVRVARASFGLFGLVAVVCYLVKFDLARSYVAVALPVGLTLVLLARWLLVVRLHRERSRGLHLRRTLLVGAWGPVHDLGLRLKREPGAGFDVVGVCLAGPIGDVGSSPVADAPIVGTMEQAAAVAESLGVDAVVVAAANEATPKVIKQLAWDLEPLRAELVVAPGLADVASPRMVVTTVDGLPVLKVTPPGYTGVQHVVKRAADIVLSAVMLAILLGPLLVVGCLVRVTSSGPALYKQTRVGLNGRPFTLYKLRSMYADADERLPHLRALDRGAGVLFKIPDDPRVTPLGRLMRRYSLDEFPQLWNVLRGDMSLVGPRPPLEREVARYDAAARRRLLVKPGVTGLWQVGGRSNLSWEDSVRLDLYYVENWSFLGDLAILMRTARAVLFPSGAY